MKCSEKKIVRLIARVYFSSEWGRQIENFYMNVWTRRKTHFYMSTKYSKRSKFATFEGFGFITFYVWGNIFWENQDLISYMDQGSVIREQGTGNRNQGTGNCELKTENWKLWTVNGKLRTDNWDLSTGNWGELKNGNWELNKRLGFRDHESMINKQWSMMRV